MDRAALIELSRKKIIPPFTLEESLTFYCPQENLEAFDHPVVSRFHRFMTSTYEPPVRGSRSVMLILPCTKDKPYVMSREHLTVNSHLLKVGFQPVSQATVPDGLGVHLPSQYDEAVLNNGLLERNGLPLHRFVVSEPMGLVPYELIYHFRGDLSPASRYDDPGLFEHRPNTVCPWREDHTGIKKGRQLRWGENEKLIYVQVHNRLVQLIAAIVERLRSHYVKVLAYVSPGLTHRSFLSSVEEKKANGLRTARRISGSRYPLQGVNDLHPGLVTIVPSKDEFQHIHEAVEGRLRAEQPSLTPAKVRGYFARGGGGATPLVLPEALHVLDSYLVR